MDDFEAKQEAKFHKMTETPVGRLICELAVPCIISMLITSYNINYGSRHGSQPCLFPSQSRSC